MQLVSLPLQVLEEIVDPVERLVAFPEQLLSRLGQVLEWDRDIHVVTLHREEHLFLPPVGSRFAPGFDRTLGQRLIVIRYDQFRIVPEHVAEALTLRASAEWMIEREEDGPQWFERSPAA